MALELHSIKPSIRSKPRKRIGRGNSSGQGTYSGRGLKGQKARSGGKIRPGFEGGRSSIIIQTPKMRGKGFVSRHPADIVIKLSDLNIFKDGESVTIGALRDKGLVKSGPVKVLASGKLSRKLVVKIPVSAKAKEMIEKAGGSVSKEQRAKEQRPQAK